MLPKDGDLSDVRNWRSIAILPILYKAFAKIFYFRLSPQVFRCQSFDQHAFALGVRIEDALLCAEVAIENALEYHMPL